MGEWGDLVHNCKHLEQSRARTPCLICISVAITLYTDEETEAQCGTMPKSPS